MDVGGLNSVDLAFVGEQLRGAVEELGEMVTFTKKVKTVLDDGTFIEEEIQIQCKMCLSNAHSSDNITANTVFKFEGEMIFPESTMIEELRGLYFTRDLVPNKKYILVSTTEIPFSSTLANIEVVECNKIIDIGKIEEVFNPVTGNYENTFVALYEKVDTFYDTTAKTPQQTEVGDVPKTIISVTIPAIYPLTSKDLIQSDEFIESKGIMSYGKQRYDVIEVDSTFASTLDGIDFQGVFIADMIKTL